MGRNDNEWNVERKRAEGSDGEIEFKTLENRTGGRTELGNRKGRRGAQRDGVVRGDGSRRGGDDVEKDDAGG